jgi:hypothetical protein
MILEEEEFLLFGRKRRFITEGAEEERPPRAELGMAVPRGLRANCAKPPHAKAAFGAPEERREGSKERGGGGGV